MLFRTKFITIISIFSITCYGASKQFWQQVTHVSDHLRGIPYELSSSGDLLGHESGQLMNTSSFDCMTFVTYSLATATSNPMDWTDNWLAMRYIKSPYNFQNRRHFTSIDFNPLIQQRFQIENISAAINPEFVQQQTFHLAKNQWLFGHCQKHNCVTWQSILNANKIDTVTISYLPAQSFLNDNGEIRPDLIAHFPETTLVEFVRNNWPIGGVNGTNIAISHMGFIVKKNGQLWLRHAKWHQEVLDEPLAQYLQKISKNQSLLGLAIFQ